MFSQNQSEIKLEWMYKGPQSTVEREDYLLGKSVDKSLEQLNVQEKQQQSGIQQPKNHVEHECIPPSIRDYKEQLGEQVDINAKLQEDPLIAIKKREEENRRQFLNNPVQIKKLQKALKLQKSKKEKKRKHCESDSDEDIDIKLAKKLKSLKNSEVLKSKSSKSSKSGMLDTILMHKYNQMKSQLSKNDIRDILEGKKSNKSSASGSSSDESVWEEKSSKTENDNSEKNDVKQNMRQDNKETYRNKSKYDKNRYKKSSSNDEKRDRYYGNKQYRNELKGEDEHDIRRKAMQKHNKSSDSDSDREYYKKRTDKASKSYKEESTNLKKTDREWRHSSSSKGEESKKSYNSKSRNFSDSSDDSDKKPSKKNWGLVKADGSKIPLNKYSHSSRSVDALASDKLQVNKSSNIRKREVLTEEEKEKRRREMAVNASWRDKERAKNLKIYRETNLKEDKEQSEYKPEFIKRELLKSANSSSVESRIKANINNIQRSGSDMSRHFSKR